MLNKYGFVSENMVVTYELELYHFKNEETFIECKFNGYTINLYILLERMSIMGFASNIG
jgi:hypothetical protein